MTTLTVEELRADFSVEDATDLLLDYLSGMGFEVDSWQPGELPRSLVMMTAYGLFYLRGYMQLLSTMAYNPDAVGTALTALSESHYVNDRLTATYSVGRIVLTGAAAGPPHTVAVDDVVVSDGVTTWRNKEAGTIPASGTLALSFTAETAGTVGNVGNGTITTMVTPFAGVTCNNPDPGTGSWITTLATNAESDEALRARNVLKWNTLSTIEATSDRYEYIARNTVSNVRVYVDDTNPRGPGTIDLYIALEDGVATATEVTAVQDAITAEKFGTQHLTIAAPADTLAITATVYYTSGYVSATVEAAVETAIDAYLNAAPIGGYSYTAPAVNIIDRDGLADVIRGVPGVQKVTITSPASDYAVTPPDVVVPGTHTLTMVAVVP